MALITCPDCKTEISDTAPSCPKCARPMAAGDTKKSSSLTSTGLGLAAVGAILCFTGLGEFYGMMGGVLAILAGGAMFLMGLSKR